MKHKTICFWSLMLLSIGIFTGCDDVSKSITNKMVNPIAHRNAKVNQSLQNALTTSTNVEALAWRFFLGKWPLAKQSNGFSWHENLKRFQGSVSGVTLIEDRYLFEAILKFDLDSDYKEIEFSKMRFHFYEVKQVIVPPGGATAGGWTVLFQPDAKEFGLKEWGQLVGSGWNFSRIGITVVSNAPIQNIKMGVNAF